MKISLIITTYNWPSALSLSLLSACRQTHAECEIIVADDGSRPETAQVIAQISARMDKPIFHVWQVDKGFRAAMIRNRAIAQARGDYLIFVDGDCVLPPDFVNCHVWLAQPGYFVAGSRVQFSPAMTAQLLAQADTLPDIDRRTLWRWWMQGRVRRIHPVMQWPFQRFRYGRTTRWQGAVTCNMAVWRRDVQAINGFDNRFIGWGREDSDFVVRLMHNGVLRKDGKLGSYVLHLHHRQGGGQVTPDNQTRFDETLRLQSRQTASGLHEVLALE